MEPGGTGTLFFLSWDFTQRYQMGPVNQRGLSPSFPPRGQAEGLPGRGKVGRYIEVLVFLHLPSARHKKVQHLQRQTAPLREELALHSTGPAHL
jgi:hypothetical protein